MQQDKSTAAVVVLACIISIQFLEVGMQAAPLRRVGALTMLTKAPRTFHVLAIVTEL
jgi:hypothetical protein